MHIHLSRYPLRPRPVAYVALAVAVALVGGAPGNTLAGAGYSTQAAPLPQTRATRDARFHSFSTELDAQRELLKVPGLSAAIVEKGEVVWSQAYGLRDKRRKLPATTDTLYPIASLTKTFTALLVMQMVEQGKMSLDDPVSRYFSGSPSPAESDVAPSTTIRHYLSHTSEGVPGTRFSYNSERFARLALILEKISAKSFRALVTENIFDKAGMTASIPGLDAAVEHGDRYEVPMTMLAWPHALHSGELEPLMFPPEHLSGATGAISSVLDLAKYVTALRAHTLLTAASTAKMWTPATSPTANKLPYGLGWFTQDFQGHKLVWHYGQEVGFSSLLLIVPDRDIAFVLLANSNALSEPFWLLYGDVARSPFALAFLRGFVVDKTVVTPTVADKSVANSIAPIVPPDWNLAPAALSHELAQKDSSEWNYADDLLDRAFALSWTGDRARSSELFKLALSRYPQLRKSAGAALLSTFARSGDAQLEKSGEQIGRELLAAAPDDPRTLFDLGVLLLHMHRGDEAAALFKRVVENPHATNRGLLAWSAYMLAEEIAPADPAQARAYLKTAIATEYDEGDLQADAQKLLEKLSKH